MSLEEIILSLLRLQKGHISAKNLANETGMSISAISKRIKLLRKYGYDIESSHRRGYRLASETDLPVPWELAKVLDTLFVGKDKIIYRLTTYSTQDLAILLAEKNPDSDGTVIIAEHQKSGRYMAISRLKTKYACFQYHTSSVCCSACSM